MLEMWFVAVAGIALGTIVTGFCAIGSYDRGSDSVRRKSWSVEHDARTKAAIVSRARPRRIAQAIVDGALKAS
jgi:hypothetical protein